MSKSDALSLEDGEPIVVCPGSKTKAHARVFQKPVQLCYHHARARDIMSYAPRFPILRVTVVGLRLRQENSFRSIVLRGTAIK